MLMTRKDDDNNMGYGDVDNKGCKLGFTNVIVMTMAVIMMRYVSDESDVKFYHPTKFAGAGDS